MKVLFAGALALLLAACAAPPAETPAPPAAPAVETNDPAAACRARGGALERICRMQSLQCVIRYADAGKKCSNDADCEGKCLAGEGVASGMRTIGRCQASSNPCGCNTPVDNGVAGPTLCVD
jgi:putative hemolysin